MAEKVLSYNRAIVAQLTSYWCGPATLQNILDNRGIRRTESSLASRMGTTTNGTNHIGLLSGVLNAELPNARYRVVQMPNDPPTASQREALWRNVKNSIDAGYGVAVNIVAPPSNYPRAVSPSTVSPAYGGGTVYHYIAVMGYSDVGRRRFWVADSGFRPFGYWCSAAQLASLIPPKGYAYASATPAPVLESGLTDQEWREIAANMGYVADQFGPRLDVWGPESSLGVNSSRQELTVRDALAKFLREGGQNGR